MNTHILLYVVDDCPGSATQSTVQQGMHGGLFVRDVTCQSNTATYISVQRVGLLAQLLILLEDLLCFSL